MAASLTMSSHAVEVLKQHEGLRVNAYRDAAGVLTIGYGHTRNVIPGLRISIEKAHDLLLLDIRDAEDCVNNKVSAPLNQNQFDALVSFVFNVGCGAFERSTLLRLLNLGEHAAAAQQFPRWNKAGGKVLAGLVTRRAAERDRFLREVES